MKAVQVDVHICLRSSASSDVFPGLCMFVLIQPHICL